MMTSLLKRVEEFSKYLAYADDLMLLVEGRSVVKKRRKGSEEPGAVRL